MNNDVKWRRLIVLKKVDQINDHLFIDTYKWNNIKIGVNKMTVNDSEMSVRWKGQAWSIPEISVLRWPRLKQTKEERKSERDGFSTC